MTGGVLAGHADIVRSLGSPFVASILEAGDRQLGRAPHTAALIAGWPRDAAADAVAMRFAGALHALAQAGADAELGMLYRDGRGDTDRIVGAAMARGDGFIADWMRHPPQTNEVGRTGAVMAALMVLRGRWDMPCELRELGASAGLNLNLLHYAHDLGGVGAGRARSPVRIAPRWHGAPPPDRPVVLASVRGVDLSPLRVSDRAARARLTAYVWPDQIVRAARLGRALRIARRAPPPVDRGDIVAWLPAALAAPQRAETCRVILHSMVLQYLDTPGRALVEAALADAGARATVRRPLARIGFEWTAARDAVHLLLTTWPGGGVRHLATCHPYGDWIDWHAPAGDPPYP